jgi:hypothetical protein
MAAGQSPASHQAAKPIIRSALELLNMLALQLTIHCTCTAYCTCPATAPAQPTALAQLRHLLSYGTCTATALTQLRHLHSYGTCSATALTQLRHLLSYGTCNTYVACPARRLARLLDMLAEMRCCCSRNCRCNTSLCCVRGAPALLSEFHK